MSNDLIPVASFDEALQVWKDRFGDLPNHIKGMSPYLFGADDAPGGYHARSDVGERTTEDGTPLTTLWDEFQVRWSTAPRCELPSPVVRRWSERPSSVSRP